MRAMLDRLVRSSLGLNIAATLLLLLACDRGSIPSPQSVLPHPPKGTGSHALAVTVLRSDIDQRAIPGAVVILETPAGGTLATTTFGSPPAARFLEVDPPYTVTAIAMQDVGEDLLEAAFTVAGITPASGELILPLTIEANFPPIPGRTLAEPKATLTGVITGLAPSAGLAFAATHERGILLNSLEIPALEPAVDPADPTRALLPAIELPAGALVAAAFEPAVDPEGGLLTFSSFGAHALDFAAGANDASLAVSVLPGSLVPLAFVVDPEPGLGTAEDTLRLIWRPADSPLALRLLTQSLAPGSFEFLRVPSPDTLPLGGGRYVLAADRAAAVGGLFLDTASGTGPLDATAMNATLDNPIELRFLTPTPIVSPSPNQTIPAPEAGRPFAVQVDSLGQSYGVQGLIVVADNPATSLPYDLRWQVVGPPSAEVRFPDLKDPALPSITPSFFFPGVRYALIAVAQDLGEGATLGDLATGLPGTIATIPVIHSATTTQSFVFAVAPAP